MNENLRIAQTILEQLGGRRFVVMTGAKNLTAGENSLTMKIGRNAAGVSVVKITLMPSDTYEVEFFRQRKGLIRIKKFEDVYCEQLQEIFTENTGMYTSL